MTWDQISHQLQYIYANLNFQEIMYYFFNVTKKKNIY